ncbi:DAK2 domain-containing protein [Corynebacterium incognita]|uniref:DAK2 domain-containing protein n=1 Tax=Corynebacterium incognita TaxID=2754725 RepID=A0A7G7CPF3_9CORY|nr:DAK2 domain-containing protein [Corynebacterium incognita]QNE89469.1 DAK2 domain-containing protein [Corynebacterium incognita]
MSPTSPADATTLSETSDASGIADAGRAPATAPVDDAVIDASVLEQWARLAVEELERCREDINALNVFPVPDSDTGSNLLHTMKAAVAEMDNGGPVAEALALGSVRGARGNSGMVLSQVLRGVADSAVEDHLDAHGFAEALHLAVNLVNRAISDPVEGTVLTVLRASADAANEMLRHQPKASVAAAVQQALDAAEEALIETTTQLEALREAGVVDAGATGYVVVLRALRDVLDPDTSRDADVDKPEAQGTKTRPGAGVDEAGDNRGDMPADVHTGMHNGTQQEIEVVLFFTGDIAALERSLKPMGNSLVVARANEDRANVHIHTRKAGEVIEAAYAAGQVSDLHLEVLPGAELPDAEATTSREPRVIAMAPPGEVAQLFAETGAIVVSNADELAQLGVLNAEDIVLPNGQLADTGEFQAHTAATVIRTGSLVAGVAALAVYSPLSDDPIANMVDAVGTMRVVRPAEESVDAIIRACRDELAEGGEQITVLTSVAVDAEALTEVLESNVYGGQSIDVIVVPVTGVATEIGVE